MHLTTRSTLSRRRYHRAMRQLETLETRVLMSITPTTLSFPGTDIAAAAFDAQGHLWVIDSLNGQFDQVVNGTLVPQAISGIQFVAPQANMVAGTGALAGQFFVSDSNTGGIDDINLNTGTVTMGSLLDHLPNLLAVSGDGDLWFTSTDGKWVGTYDPMLQTAQYASIGAVGDASASSIGAAGADGVWLGIPGDNQLGATNQSYIGAAALSGGIITEQNFAVNVGNSPSQYVNVSGVADDGNGGVWFTIGNGGLQGSPTLDGFPDTFVHWTSNGTSSGFTQNTYTVSDDLSPLLIRNPSLDSAGHLWFTEFQGTQAGYLDVTNPNAAPVTVTQPSGSSFASGDLEVNPTTSEAVALSGDGTTLLDMVVPQQQNVTFNGAAGNITGPADVAVSLTGNFTANAGSYTATINWGDSSTSSATITGSGTSFSFTGPADKSFAEPGIYDGVITVSNGSNTVGTIGFTSTISALFTNASSPGISGREDTPQTLVGEFTASAPLGSYSAIINWGDNTSSTATLQNLGPDPDGGFDYSVSFVGKVYSIQGTYNGTITVIDSASSVGTIGVIPFTSVLTDIPLVVTNPVLVNTNGKFFDLSASFSDDPDSTKSWFTVSIDWGDGSTSTGSSVVIVPDAANPGHYFVMSTHHKYKKGTYNVTLTVVSHDEAGLVSTVTATSPLTVD